MANTVRVRSEYKDGLSKPLANLRSSWQKMQTEGAKGLAIGVGITAATKGLDLLGQGLSAGVDYMKGAITSASDLNETVSKTGVVFGDSAQEVIAWGDKTAMAIGLSKQSALEAAATFGNLFESMGVGQQAASDLSVKMVNLAGDLASFNNLDPTEVLQKLQSGIVGETKAVRDLGIDISETTVQQELMAEGVAKVNGQYTNAQKIQARYALIIKQTGNAQGDFARTSDGLANSQRAARRRDGRPIGYRSA